MKNFWVSVVNSGQVITAHNFEAKDEAEALGKMYNYLQLEFCLPNPAQIDFNKL